VSCVNSALAIVVFLFQADILRGLRKFARVAYCVNDHSAYGIRYPVSSVALR